MRSHSAQKLLNHFSSMPLTTIRESWPSGHNSAPVSSIQVVTLVPPPANGSKRTHCSMVNPRTWLIHATHRGGAHTVITRSSLARTGYTMSNCIRLPGVQGEPFHSTGEPYTSEKDCQRFQSEKIFHAKSHGALV